MIKWSATKRLIMGFSLIIFVLGIVIVFDSYSISKDRHIENTLALAYNMKIQLLECRREEKNIIIRGLIDEHMRKWESAFMEMKKTEAQLVTKGYISAQARQLIEGNIDEYGRIYQALINDLRKGKILNLAEVSNYDERFKVTCHSIEASIESALKEITTEKEETGRSHLFWGGFIAMLGIIFSLILGYRTIKFTRRNIKELESAVREIEDSSMQLALGLSEQFEALKKIADGDFKIEAPETSDNELIARLGRVINQTKEQLMILTRQELEQLYLLAGSGIRVVNKEFKVLKQNPAMAKLSGTGLKEVSEIKCYEHFKDNFCQTDNCALKQILAGKESVEREIEKEGPDGRKVFCLLKALPMRNLQGDIIGITESFTDITELKTITRDLENSSMQLAVGLSEIFEVLNRVATGNLDIQAPGQLENELLNQLAIVVNRTIANLKEIKSELERQHDWLQTTLSSIGDAVIATDVEKRINFMNPMAEHLTGWTAQEAMGENIDHVFQIIDERTRKIYDTPFELLFREGVSMRLPHNILLVAKDGREAPINDSMAVIRKKDGVSYGAVLVFRDITERKQMEMNLIQSAKMAVVGQLSAGVAHEINNPLTGVLNNVQLIKMELGQSPDASGSIAQFKETLDSIEESALRCKKIIQSLLDFSHAHKLIIQPVSINEIIEKSLALIGHELKLENILLQTELPAQLPLVLGNSQLLQQVVMNIIANAQWAIKKKSGREGGAITIKTQYDAQNRKIHIYITDTGIGMSDEALKKIFEPFFTTKEVGEGTGLGLSVVYGIIKEHEGKIEAESQPDKGATFKITLPALLEKKNA